MRYFLVFLLALFAASCGQKGPLYLRDNPPAGIKPPKPEPYQPTPYPKESGKDAVEDEAREKK